MRTPALFFTGLFFLARLQAQTDAPAQPVSGEKGSLLSVLGEELEYSIKNLAKEEKNKLYYLAYTVTDSTSITVMASLGALFRNSDGRGRELDVDVRVGDYALDNTHQIRGGAGASRFGGFFGGSASVPLENNPIAVKHALWQATDRTFKSAVERFQRVQTDLKTTVEEESKAHDFSREAPSVFAEGDAALSWDREAWAERVRAVSRLALKYPLIHDSMVAVLGAADNRYLASSEGSRLKTAGKRLRVIVSASTKAEDGMDLSQSFIFNTASETGLPSEETLREIEWPRPPRTGPTGGVAPGKPYGPLDQDRAVPKIARDARGRMQEAEQAVWLPLRRHHGRFHDHFPGRTASVQGLAHRRLSRLCGWPPR